MTTLDLTAPTLTVRQESDDHTSLRWEFVDSSGAAVDVSGWMVAGTGWTGVDTSAAATGVVVTTAAPGTSGPCRLYATIGGVETTLGTVRFSTGARVSSDPVLARVPVTVDAAQVRVTVAQGVPVAVESLAGLSDVDAAAPAVGAKLVRTQGGLWTAVPTVLDVRAFGASPGAAAVVNDVAIQAALDVAATTVGGTVVLGGGPNSTYLTEAGLTVGRRATLEIPQGVRLRRSTATAATVRLVPPFRTTSRVRSLRSRPAARWNRPRTPTPTSAFRCGRSASTPGTS